MQLAGYLLSSCSIALPTLAASSCSWTASVQSVYRPHHSCYVTWELPRFSPEEYAARAKRYLDHAAADLAEPERVAIVKQAITVLYHPELAVLFGPDSRAEVPILGRWDESGRPFEDFGRVDRLAVTASEVWIADFKSDAVPPLRLADTPKVYLRQLARYRAVLTRLYPGKAMRAFVVWTATGAIQEIPGVALDEAFTRLTAA